MQLLKSYQFNRTKIEKTNEVVRGLRRVSLSVVIMEEIMVILLDCLTDDD